jgi:hypothetical protein
MGIGSAIMLILKGNFIKYVARIAVPTVLLAAVPAGAGAAGQAAWAAPAGAAARPAIRAPEVVAAEFSGWYLETLAADQDPLSDRHERFAAYVARPLVEQLVQRLQARAGPLSAAPDARMPEMHMPDVRTPDARTPDARTPDARTPDARMPDARTSDARTPDAAAPGQGDYFLQADRIDGAWLRSRVRAITVRQQARAAHVLVTLDGDEGAKYGLLLTMVLDNGAWKIRHVNRTSVDASESSPDRPII